MGRFRRFVRYGLSIVSLVLLLATLGAWANGGKRIKPSGFHRLVGRWGYIIDGSNAPEGVRAFDVLVVHWRQHPIVGPAWAPNGSVTPALNQWLSQYPFHQFFTSSGFG